MLKLVDVNKVYKVGDMSVQALKNISLEFRQNEMVSILGPSGCGKTTMLNIIGGLDKYTSGDLIINGISTKEYRECDWDAYRNASIGFVFQSYNLISHQTVLENVELALTLSGVGAVERRERAIKALQEVGLGDQLKKKPNQLSGGQMQRVAIARALINNPDIVLADEPTGALDSVTSVQIMELLKEVSKTRLVILVTHNGELADQYSDRIIRLLDGEIISDTRPVDVKKDEEVVKKRPKKTSMSFGAAFRLSLRNLFTKKARTFITSFAGSIGIIGVALILALSAGFSGYVNRMQADTMSSFPITIASTSMDMTSMMSLVENNSLDKFPEAEEIYVNNVMEQLSSMVQENEITEDYVENAIKTIDKSLVNDIIYDTGAQLNIYKKEADYGGGVYMRPISTDGMMGMGGWTRIIDSPDLINSQYDVLEGKLPQSKTEVVLCVNEYNQLMDISLMGALGLNIEEGKTSFTFEELMSVEYKLLTNDILYQQKTVGGRTYFEKRSIISQEAYDQALTLKIVGIVRLKEGASAGAISGTIGYHGDLIDYLLEENINSQVVTWQKQNPDLVFDCNSDDPALYTYRGLAMESLGIYGDYNSLPDVQKIAIDNEVKSLFDDNIAKLGGSLTPVRIDIYPVDFESKELIKAHLDDYNNQLEEEGKNPVAYSDMMGLMFGALNVMVDAVSYVLIAFTSISLVVSSIMIGVITYTSVLERTKEIGILKALGARKKDISRVFNAESLIIGFASGLIGVLFTWLVSIPLNSLLLSLTEIPGLVTLGFIPAIVLVGISMLLTFVAGLVPSRVAAKKDAVIALRTE